MPLPTFQSDGELNFLLGQDSQSDSLKLAQGTYCRGMNVVNRGGVVQTRPGYRWMCNLPEGKLQGLHLFRPLKATPQLVVVVEGKVYVSEPPFTTFTWLSEITFCPYADQIFWADAQQAVTLNPDGSLSFVRPRLILFMQDGYAPPAWYDGSACGHTTDPDGVPQGTAMCWSGNRLWVAQRNLIYASDIWDPFHYTENLYLGGTDAFMLEHEVTAMANVGGSGAPQNLLVFSEKDTTMFQSQVLQRNLWTSIQDFQTTLFPTIGCKSQRSVISLHGRLYWFSQYGLTSYDAARSVRQTSEFFILDNEMADSKSRMWNRQEFIACSRFENYLLVSVPVHDAYNHHTWVLDHNVLTTLTEKSPAVWNAFWTGTRPVEWASGDVNGQERCFHISVDYDGTNRLWEAFQSERQDHGVDITAWVEMRALQFGTRGKKHLRYADIHWGELSGVVDMKVQWAGAERGKYKTALLKRVEAPTGDLDAQAQLTMASQVFAYKKQSRWTRTADIRATYELLDSSAGVESADQEQRDYAFQLLVTWCGQAAILECRAFADMKAEQAEGVCEADESTVRAVRFDGAAAAGDLTPLNASADVYDSMQSITLALKGRTTTQTAVARSHISQETADKVALQIATQRAVQHLQAICPPDYSIGLFVGQPAAPLVPVAGQTVIAFVSDTGLPSANHNSVAAEVLSWNPDLVVMGGDINDSANPANYTPALAAYSSFVTNGTLIAAAGNHDFDLGCGAFLFGFLGQARYFSRRVGNIEVFVLSTGINTASSGTGLPVCEPDGNDETSVQALWLQAAMASSTAPWKIVVMHQAPYVSGTTTNNYYPGQLRLRWPFHAWGADLVLSGHSHVYERLVIGGCDFIAGGGGGQNTMRLFNPALVYPGSVVRYSETSTDNFAMRIWATPVTFTLTCITKGGVLVDVHTMTK
jgi:predicted phosphodiesterase